MCRRGARSPGGPASRSSSRVEPLVDVDHRQLAITCRISEAVRQHVLPKAIFGRRSRRRGRTGHRPWAGFGACPAGGRGGCRRRRGRLGGSRARRFERLRGEQRGRQGRTRPMPRSRGREDGHVGTWVILQRRARPAYSQTRLAGTGPGTNGRGAGLRWHRHDQHAAGGRRSARDGDAGPRRVRGRSPRRSRRHAARDRPLRQCRREPHPRHLRCQRRRGADGVRPGAHRGAAASLGPWPRRDPPRDSLAAGVGGGGRGRRLRGQVHRHRPPAPDALRAGSVRRAGRVAAGDHRPAAPGAPQPVTAAPRRLRARRRPGGAARPPHRRCRRAAAGQRRRDPRARGWPVLPPGRRSPASAKPGGRRRAATCSPPSARRGRRGTSPRGGPARSCSGSSS